LSYKDFYGISAVKYDEDYTHIAYVRQHLISQGRVDSGQVVPRLTVIANVHKGILYRTITQAPNGSWNIGAVIQIIHVNGIDYIRADGNLTPQDNLGQLPLFW
jgi:Protein of unknown function (DUF3892)